MGRTWKLQLPAGVADPLFTCELALELGMTVSELGDRMSTPELTVMWPEYFAYRSREQKRQADAQNEAQKRQGGRR